MSALYGVMLMYRKILNREKKMVSKSLEAEFFLRSRLLGFRVERGLTTFNDNTRKNVLGVRTGNKDKARGSAEIETIDGFGLFETIPIPGISNVWVADIVFTIRYKATSQGERFLFPGDAFVDRLWNGNESRGTIKATLRIQPQTNGSLVLDISVDPDADDRPGNFVKDFIAPLFRDSIDNSLEQFTNTSIN
jgi:hypothetical protein